MTPIGLLRRLSTRGDISDETSAQCDEAADQIAALVAAVRAWVNANTGEWPTKEADAMEAALALFEKGGE